ncbi:MAG: heavy metal translocating P-type ATPase [Mariprofundales bacterium]|nr:heavy metal translocating P-type ATPase [Mariprofundales bacterium]
MSTGNCFHCGLAANGSTLCYGEIDGEQQPFCCSGCLSVCQVIHDAGLESFYSRVQRQPQASMAPPPETPADIEQYELPELQQEFVQQLADGTLQAQLMVEGIHCAACVWLIERALGRMRGIVRSEVNLVHHRLLLQWQPDQLSLSEVIARLAEVGYSALPFNLDSVAKAAERENRQLLFRLGFAGFGAMNIMWIAIALYAGDLSGLSDEYRHFFHWVSLAIATPVLLYSGGAILLSAWRSLWRGELNMDLPIAIGALATFSYSLWQTINGAMHIYFDTVVIFLFVILIGRYLEAVARHQASSATMQLLELQPRMATRLTVEGGEERVSVRQLTHGDRLLIKPGERVPADGYIVEGSSHIDESMLTGESQPVQRGRGGRITGGTINGESPLIMQVEAVGEEMVLSRIIHLVEAAQSSKAPIQRLADQIAPWFVLATLLLAAITMLYWWSHGDFNTALLAATSVLIITCPCALGLATPMAVAVSSGFAAKQGVLVRSGEALERVSTITHVVVDKTGTLTTGRMRITEVIVAEQCQRSQDDLLQLAGSVERHYSHPLAQAICASVEERALPLLPCSRQQLLPGVGVSGSIHNQTIHIGNLRLMEREGVAIPAAIAARYHRVEREIVTPILIAANRQLLGLLCIADQLRPGAVEMVNCLKKQRIAITILTGDSATAATPLHQQLSHHTTTTINLIADLLPEEKAEQITRLQQQGERVLMVGDGINDAPALARADISIAMGSGTDLSLECSDIVLMSSDLNRIPWTLAIGRQTLTTIRQNLLLSLLYNATLLPVAMAALVTPVFAALAMPISSLLVIGNATLIKWHMARHRVTTVAHGHFDAAGGQIRR